MTRPITFLSDYGYEDEFAGVCKAVIARIAPEARVIDLTHGIARHDVRQGAAVLANALPFAPPGIHLAVVDPEVGTERRAVAIRVAGEDRVLVGPDNGLLWPAIERLGGPREAADISLSPFRLEPLSATFHGRDVFAPVAATLAQGATLGDVGTPLDPDALTPLESSQAQIEGGRTLAHVAYLDRYGNAVLDFGQARLPETGLRLGHPTVVETRAGSGGGGLCPHLRRRRRGPAAALRGLLREPRAGDQPRQRGGRAAPRPGRRGRPAARLEMTGFGWPRRHLRVTGSTNERARELALQGAPGGTVVTAEAQTSGRGRRGRAWVTPPGKALLYSAILRPIGSEHALLPLAVPLAVCEAVEALAALRSQVKWPNDVWIEERKVAGVLLEARPPDWAVIGIGLNLAVEPAEFPPDLRWPATSVGHGVTAAAALAAVNESLGRWAGAPLERVLEEFAARDALRGREIRWEGAGGDSASGAGRAEGIDERGHLLVATEDGRQLSLGAGEVQLTLQRSERPQR